MAKLIRLCAGLSLSLVSLSLFACAEDMVEIPESQIGEPICMLAGSLGHYADGSQHKILTPDHSLPSACACLPPEDRHEWDQETIDMLADMTLEDCERVAATYYDFAWNECRSDYEARVWEVPIDKVLRWYPFWVGPGSDMERYDHLGCVLP